MTSHGTTASAARHLFLGGVHRSGKSLLHRLLLARADVTGLPARDGRDEGQHLQDVVTRARAHGGPGRFAFDPRATLTAADATPGRVEALHAAWDPLWDASDGWLVEQSPPNLLRAGFLAAAYPGARIVHVTRHPLAVSRETGRWVRELDLETLLRHWVVAHDLAREHASEADDVHWVSYEALVADPGGVVRHCLDLPGETRVDLPLRLRTDGNDDALDAWRARRASRLRRRWADRLVARLEPDVRRLGYSLVDLDRHPGITGAGGQVSPG